MASRVAAFLFTDPRAIVGFVGLLVYGVVRVAYDAFYSRLGTSPEAVGLSEARILGRAALYLFVFVAVAVAVGGSWVLLTRLFLSDFFIKASRRATSARKSSFASRLDTSTAVMVSAGLGLLLAMVSLFRWADHLRDTLINQHVVYFCTSFCDIGRLTRGEYDETLQQSSSFHDIGNMWLIAIVGCGLILAILISVVIQLSGTRYLAVLIIDLAYLGLVSLSLGLLIPHFSSLLDAIPKTWKPGELSALEEHPFVLKWLLFALALLTIVSCAVPALGGLALRWEKTAPLNRRAGLFLDLRWIMVCFFLGLPLMVGWFTPKAVLVLEGEGLAALLAAIALWIAVTLTVFLTVTAFANIARSHARVPVALAAGRPGTGSFAIAVPLLGTITALALYLAGARGAYLGEQAAAGVRIGPQHFNIISVTADVVCLDAVSDSFNPSLEADPYQYVGKPYQYLGQSDSMLVLYDFVRGRDPGQPHTLPLRVPASSFVLRLASHSAKPGDQPPGTPKEWYPWNCESPITENR